MDTNIRFWTDTADWPADAQGYVFLGRAVHEVGRFLFVDAWTGQEPATLPMVRLTNKPPAADYGELLRAHKLLVKFHPEFARKPPEGLSISFTDEEWKALADTISQHNGHCARFEQVASQIVLWCRTEKLEVGFRPLEGGAIIGPQSSILWQTEQWYSRFERCRISPEAFRLKVKPSHYIFVSRQSLDQCLGLQHLSPVPSNEQPVIAQQLTLQGKIKNKRSWRPNEISDDELEEQLRKLEMVARVETTFPAKSGLMRKLGATLHKSGAKIGMNLAPDTIRQVLGDRYPPATRLVVERGIKDWWRGPAKGSASPQKRLRHTKSTPKNLGDGG